MRRDDGVEDAAAHLYIGAAECGDGLDATARYTRSLEGQHILQITIELSDYRAIVRHLGG